MKQTKSPEEWVDDGVPWPPQRDTMIRWVALIQEDAVSCYSVTEAIEEVEEAFSSLSSKLEPSVTDGLRLKIEALLKYKMPLE